MWRPQARMSPSTRRWPTRCMPTRLWKPTAGTGLANSAQLAGEAVRLKAAFAAAPVLDGDALADAHRDRLRAAQHREGKCGQPGAPLQRRVAIKRRGEALRNPCLSCPA